MTSNEWLEHEFTDDLQFAFGSLFSGDFSSPAHSVVSHPPPNHVFFCADLATRTFVSGESYSKTCRITQDGISTTSELKPGKQLRNVKAFNFLHKHMDKSLSYAFNTQDAQDISYNEYFRIKHSIPVFQYHRRKGRDAIIIPLVQYHTFPGWNIPNFADEVSFRKKQSKIFWRGNLAGTTFIENKLFSINVFFRNYRDADQIKDNLLKFPRVSVVAGLAGSDQADVGFSSTPDIPEMSGKNIGEKAPWLKSLFMEKTPAREQIRYRYLLALDGFDGPSSMYWMFRTKSLVFRHESPWEMFGDHAFLPWKTYIPVKPNREDIMEKFEWCENNLDACEQIVEQANLAWNSIFDSARFDARLQFIFNLYSAKLRDKI